MGRGERAKVAVAEGRDAPSTAAIPVLSSAGRPIQRRATQKCVEECIEILVSVSSTKICQNSVYTLDF